MHISPKEELTLYALALLTLIAGVLIGFTAGLGVQPV